MDSITLENYRCFREKQTARLAPLTLLVGENSTGKTSFMAMIRVLSELTFSLRNPDFKKPPYDLGSFDEIAHHRGGRVGRADTFEAGFSFSPKPEGGRLINLEFVFGQSGTAPVPVGHRISHGKTRIGVSYASDKTYVVEVGTARGSWKAQAPLRTRDPLIAEDVISGYYLYSLLLEESQIQGNDQTQESEFVPIEGSPAFSSKDLKSLRKLVSHFIRYEIHAFASAPVRSKPRRTYDPSPHMLDSEGDYVPMYLAEMSSRSKEWSDLKKRLEDFGKSAGLFDEISIKRLGRKGSEPFQVQIRKFGGGKKGPARNLIDVGYGVSQALPLITELLRDDGQDIFLLQQPEVHLHPSAQAALGSLFCQAAGSRRQLVVETHSDHLIDRVRMDVRDGASQLKPDDVSILYFERGDLDVRIHSLKIDGEGNIVGAPEGYRSFFMEEVTRSLWKP